MLSCQRSAVSLPSDVHYLNCAYMAPLLKSVEAAGRRGMRRRHLPTQIQPDDFFTESDRVRRLFARLVHAPDPSRIAIVPSVSYGMAVVARNTRVASDQTVVLAGEQFPSNVYPWRRLCRDTGATLRMVDAPEAGPDRGRRWNERLLDAIDARTALVALGNVHWADGTRFDLVSIGERAREVGAALVVDGTQSVGALPFDVQAVRPDALVCAGYKWMFGPYGVTLAYLGPRYDDGRPLEETWIGRRGSEDFSGLVDYEDAYRDGADRFDVGERSSPVLLPMMAAALEQVLAWTPEAIQAYCAALLGETLTEAQELGYSVENDAHRGTHLVGLRAPGSVPMNVLRDALDARDVLVSVRGNAVRVAPNVYNDADAAAALLDALRTARATHPTGERP